MPENVRSTVRSLQNGTVFVVICRDCEQIVAECTGEFNDRAKVAFAVRNHPGHTFETWNQRVNLAKPGVCYEKDFRPLL